MRACVVPTGFRQLSALRFADAMDEALRQGSMQKDRRLGVTYTRQTQPMPFAERDERWIEWMSFEGQRTLELSDRVHGDALIDGGIHVGDLLIEQ